MDQIEKNIRYDIEVTEARYLTGYKFWIKLSDNTERIYDMETDLWGETMQPLKDINVFKRFKIKHGTLYWPGNVSIAPEHLDLAGKPV